MLAAASAADTYLLFERHTETERPDGTSKEYNETLEAWIAPQGARMNFRDTTLLWRKDQARLYRIYHGEKRIEVFRTPVVLEEYLTPAMQTTAERALAMLNPETEIKSGVTKEEVGPWQAEKSEIRQSLDGAAGPQLIEVWSAPVPFDGRPFLALLQAHWSTDLIQRQWADTRAGLPGFPVKSRETSPHRLRTLIQTLTLTSHEEVPPKAERFEPPADYRTLPFDLSDHLQISR